MALRDRVKSALPAARPAPAALPGSQNRFHMLPLLVERQARTIAIMNNDWRTPICRGCYNGLITHNKADSPPVTRTR
jgi:hypothetical protein